MIGMLMSVSGLSAAISTLPLGILADRVGRGKVVLGSALFMGFGLLIVASTGLFYLQVIAQVFVGLSWGAGGATAALIADLERGSRLSDAYTFQFFLFNIFMAFGGFMGFIPKSLSYLGVLESYRVPFYVMAFLMLTGSVFLIPSLRKATKKGAEKKWKITSWWLLWRMGLVNVLIGFGAGLTIPIFNVYFYMKFGAGPEMMGPLAGVGGLIMALLAVYLNEVGKVKGKVKTIAGAELVAIALLLGIVATRNFFIAGVLFVLRYVLMNVTAPLINAFVMERIKVDERATLISLINLTWNLPNSGSTFIGGMLLERWVELPPLVTSFFYSVAVSLFYTFFRSSEPSNLRKGS